MLSIARQFQRQSQRQKVPSLSTLFFCCPCFIVEFVFRHVIETVSSSRTVIHCDTLQPAEELTIGLEVALTSKESWETTQISRGVGGLKQLIHSVRIRRFTMMHTILWNKEIS